MMAKPMAVAIAIFWNSLRSGFVHLLISRMESFDSCLNGSINVITWSMAPVWSCAMQPLESTGTVERRTPKDFSSSPCDELLRWCHEYRTLDLTLRHSRRVAFWENKRAHSPAFESSRVLVNVALWVNEPCFTVKCCVLENSSTNKSWFDLFVTECDQRLTGLSTRRFQVVQWRPGDLRHNVRCRSSDRVSRFDFWCSQVDLVVSL